ncbi:MAG: sugar phosphate isomerase/epimerase [Verrucomicrobia bacterium]|nr:sugar phosphate isomerase/epimerase [Verrucomicrobiota bacterium]
MLEEIRELGFEYAELSHGVRLSLVEGIMKAVDAGIIRITSLHNFCPLPVGITRAAPNVYQFTSPDPRERERAYRHTIQTLDFAQRVGAKAVVLHLGSLELPDYTERLIRMIEAGMKDSPRYQRLLYEAEERREARRPRQEPYALEILHRLEEEAARRGLVLGVENRETVEEIPFEADLPFFFLDFPSGAVRYWHDVGHAQIKQHLGLIDHVLHLESMAEHLAGCHVHDVEFPDGDHRPPGRGTVDFAALKPFIKPEHPKVLELHPKLSKEEVLEGFQFLRSVWGEE